MDKATIRVLFIISAALFFLCALLCVFNVDVLKKAPFQQTTSLSGPALAKFEKDGNVYIIDSGSFRLICMTPNGNIRYTITIDKQKEYTRLIDCAIDEAGNLYVYAMEAEYDAYLTKRDMIRKYDSRGRFVKDIISINYDNFKNQNSAADNPRLFYQFNSLRCEDRMLSFSRIERERVTLYQYDTIRENLRQTAFTGFMTNEADNQYLVAQLVVKDMKNFAYVMRDGDIFEVVNGSAPQKRASLNWSMEKGGIIPWYIQYDPSGNLVFFDMASNNIIRIVGKDLYRIVPQKCFDPLIAQGEHPQLKGFGFYNNIYSGIYGDTVWLYDLSYFTTYDGTIRLPFDERARIITVQIAFVFGIITFISGLFLLFFGILDGYVSLFIKQSAIIIPLLVAAFIILFSITHTIMLRQHNDTVFNEMLSLSVLSSRLVNGDDIDKLKTIKDIYGSSYKNLSNTLNEITGYNKESWNKGYYAALYKGDHFEYSLMLCNGGYNLFRPSSPLQGEEYHIFISGRPIGGIYSMEDGIWAVALVPVKNSAGVINAALEIGLDLVAYENSNARLKREIALIAAAICIVILTALSGLFYLVTKQLNAVANVMRDIADGNHGARIFYRAKDELGKVSDGFNTMAQELESQFNRIRTLNESTIRFVPLQFMEHLGVSDITKMKLGDNVQRDITVLFFDIRAFSIKSEMMTARENFLFINKVLGISGPIIREHKGFVDKYIGDAAMALFDNGHDAVRAAVKLYRKIVLDMETKVRIGVDSINIGIGIHTGSVMMGIVGEDERLSSTVISANVNIASRVESLSKQTGSGILITRDTLNQLDGNEGEFNYRFIGMVRAAGLNEVVGLFDILDALPDKDKQSRLSTKTIFESGVRNFHTKDYASAVERFSKVVASDPNDICAAAHLETAKEHLKDPLLPSVFVFDKK